MVAFRFSARNIEPNRALEPIPSGNYPVKIIATENKPTRAGDGSYLEVQMAIQGGEYANRRLFDRLNLDNLNPTAVEIAQKTLSAICHVTGVLDFDRTEQLHDRPFVAVVNKVPRNDQPDVMTNVVKGYKNLDGSDPGFAGQAVYPQSQPGWAQPQPQQPLPLPQPGQTIAPGQMIPGSVYPMPQVPPGSAQVVPHPSALQERQAIPFPNAAPTWAQQQPAPQSQPQPQQTPPAAAPPIPQDTQPHPAWAQPQAMPQPGQPTGPQGQPPANPVMQAPTPPWTKQ